MKVTHQTVAQYIDHMGSDITVVNAARASFNRQKNTHLDSADAKLIKFLARGYRTQEWDELANEFMRAECPKDVKAMLTEFKRHAQHWAPFAHPHVQLRVEMPVFLARQFVKHQIGGTWSEVSRRYVSDEPTFWFPNEWHTRPADIKQGSGDAVSNQALVNTISSNAVETALNAYRMLLNEGVAPEEARTVLPLNHMTTVVWTGSLLFWSRVVNQRADSHAQLAAQSLAAQISDIIEPLFPVSWKALTE